MVRIGIDLGTTNSCVAVYKNDRVNVLWNFLGERTTPSVVSFQGQEMLIGRSAMALLAFNPENTIYDAKRVIGRKFDDDNITADRDLWPFKVININGKPAFDVIRSGERESIHPEQISSMVLAKMKEIAEIHSIQVTGAVITVPAYFNAAQRQATKDAGEIAGLGAVNVLNEPTAAAFAYGFDNVKINNTILVYDLGGGTFDVSVVSIKKKEYDVLAIAGDTHLGGGDFDQLLAHYLIEDIKEKHGMDISNDKLANCKLREHCEAAKRILSESVEAMITIVGLVPGLNYSNKVSRTTFESLCVALFDKTMVLVRKALRDAKMTKTDINDVVLVGGSTRIPFVRQLLKNFFNGKELSTSISPDEAVAYGAALKAAQLDGVRSSSLPNMLLRDVTPLALGTEVGFERAMYKVVERNTKIPFWKEIHYKTINDDQTKMSFEIIEGDRPHVEDNHSLAKLTISGLIPQRAGKSEVRCIFQMDDNGILKVSARDPVAGKSKVVAITDAGNLSAERVVEMVMEEEVRRREDANERKRMMVRDEMEKYVRVLIPRAYAERRGRSVLAKQQKEVRKWLDSNKGASLAELETQLTKLKAKVGRFCDR